MFLQDQDIIIQVLQGDKDAFGMLVERYQKAIYALALSRVGESEEAADITQETFIKVYRSLDSLKDRSKFGLWIRAIVSHLSVDAIRRRIMRQAHLENMAQVSHPDTSSPPADAQVSQNESEKRILEVLSGLPENYQAPILLRYMENFSYSEIAEKLGMTRDAVRGLLYRGSRMFRERLAPLLDKDEI